MKHNLDAITLTIDGWKLICKSAWLECGELRVDAIFPTATKPTWAWLTGVRALKKPLGDLVNDEWVEIALKVSGGKTLTFTGMVKGIKFIDDHTFRISVIERIDRKFELRQLRHG